MKTFFLLSFILLLGITCIYSQKIDNTFQEPVPIRPAKINSLKTLPDGKLLIGGEISSYQDQKVNNLIKLNSDGSLDYSYDFNLSYQFSVIQVELQSNGDIIILARKYDNNNNIYTDPFLIKLSSGGTLIDIIDNLSDVKSISIQYDDKILIYGGSWGNGYLNRYNINLSEDVIFNSNITINNTVTSLTTDTNNIYLTGYFTEVNGKIKNNIVKLKLDGSIDTTFDAGSGTGFGIESITILNDEKILLSKTYIESYNDTLLNCQLLRINTDGSIDKTFSPPGFSSASSNAFIKDSAYYIAGAYSLNPLGWGSYLMRIKKDGSIDENFEMIKLDENGWYDLNLAFINNDIVFDNLSGNTNKYGLSRYDSVGKPDSTFAPEIGRYGTINACDYFLGNIIIAGDFIKINNTNTFGLAKINKNGIIDTSFIIPDQRGVVKQIEILNANEILISTWDQFFKINDKAVIQDNFNFTSFKDLYQVIKFVTTKNNKIIAGGYNNIYRLNEDGSEDKSFNIGTGIGNGCTSFDFDTQEDKVIYGSDFTKYTGIDVNRIVRLNNDGSVDTTFNVGTGPDGSVSLIKVLNNGEIIIGGNIQSFNGISIPHRLVKLSKDGEIDLTFNENQKSAGYFVDMFVENPKVIQWGNKMIIKTIYSITAFNTDGTLDNDFNIPFSISRVEDIFSYYDSLPVNVTNKGILKNALNTEDTRLKTLSVTDSANIYVNSYLYSLGKFEITGSFDPSFLIKLNMGQTSYYSNLRDYNIGSANSNGYKIYPNPIENQLNVKVGENTDILSLRIFDITGRLVNESKYFNLPENSIVEENIENLERGIYIIKVYNNHESILTKKVFKN